MIDFSFLSGWIIYPLAELSHALQGMLAGFLGSRSIIKKEVSGAICALVVTVAFATYEGFERWRIGDNADQDLENFIVTMTMTGLIYTGIHLWRNRPSR